MKKSVLYFILFISISLRADQFAYQFYNDYFAGTDKHFTSGFSLSWLDDTLNVESPDKLSRYSDFMSYLLEATSIRDINRENITAGMSISQIIITPSDTEISIPQYDDIPYSGYFAATFFVFEWNQNSFKEYRTEIGVIGPESGAGFVQSVAHIFMKNDVPQGWGTQLSTTYTLNTLFRYGEISWQDKIWDKFEVDLFNQAGFEVGNFRTNIFASSMFRIGKNYTKNFNTHYPYLREEASLIQVDKKHKGFGYSFTLGVNSEFLIYSHIFDKGYEQGYETDKNLVNGSIYSGVDLLYNRHKVTMFYQFQSPYVQEQTTADIFGGLMYSYQF